MWIPYIEDCVNCFCVYLVYLSTLENKEILKEMLKDMFET